MNLIKTFIQEIIQKNETFDITEWKEFITLQSRVRNLINEQNEEFLLDTLNFTLDDSKSGNISN